jgi:hypothetical protein
MGRGYRRVCDDDSIDFAVSPPEAGVMVTSYSQELFTPGSITEHTGDNARG